MSEVIALLGEFERAGLKLWLQDGELRFRASPGVFTPERREAAARLKKGIVEELMRRAIEAAPPQVCDAEAVWVPTMTQVGSVQFRKDVAVIGSILRCPFAVDTQALEAALEEMSARHEVLRVRFITDAADKVWGVTEKRCAVPLTIIDKRGIDGNARAAVEREAFDAAVAPFDTTCAPVWRAILVRMSDEHSVLATGFHHAIWDAASDQVFFEELAASYAAITAGVDVDLGPAPGSFRDFARWQHEVRAAAPSSPHVRYWRQKLTGARDICWLPPDRTSPVGDISQLPWVCGRVGGETVAQLKKVALQEQCSLFVIALSCYVLLIHRWSARADVVSWIAHFGRWQQPFARALGCFVSSWPMRFTLLEDWTMLDVFRHVHQAYVEALEHKDVFVETMIAVLDEVCARPRPRSTLFNFMPWDGDPDAPASAVERVLPARCGRFSPNIPFSFDLLAAERPGEISWEMRHASHLFEEETVERASMCFAALLTAAAFQPSTRIHQLDLPRISAVASCKPSNS